MQHRYAVILSLLTLTFAMPMSVQAGPSPDAKLVLHLVPAPEGVRPGCYNHAVTQATEVVTAGPAAKRYYAYVLIADVDTTAGIAGVQFGISYNDTEGEGVDVISWQECSLYNFHLEDWPGSNTGNLLTWAQNTDCQTTPVVVAGYFVLEVHGPDRFKLIPRPVDGLIQVAACGIGANNASEKVDTLPVEQLGWIDFVTGEGYNPWDPKQNILNLQNTIKRKP